MKIEGASPARLLEMLSDRFGAFEAIAYSTIKLARHVPEDELLMDVQVAEVVLEFGQDLRDAARTLADEESCVRSAELITSFADAPEAQQPCH